MCKCISICLISFIVWSFSSCKKAKPELIDTVIYTVVSKDKNNDPFTVEYNTPTGTAIEGPISQNTWLSKKIEGFKRGDYVNLKIHSNTPSGVYILSVYLNGFLVKEEVVTLPYANQVWANLPPAI